MSRSVKLLVAVVGALVLLVGAGVAVASIPDSQGVIHGCRSLKSGALRVIDSEAGQTCDSKTEAALTWNQTGPAGPQGPAGASATPETVETVIHYPVMGDGLGWTAIETLQCPSGKHAINGGVIKAVADPSWPGGSAPPQAFAAPTSYYPTENATVPESYPRPVNDGTAWQQAVQFNYASANGTYYPTDVTEFVICI